MRTRAAGWRREGAGRRVIGLGFGLAAAALVLGACGSGDDATGAATGTGASTATGAGGGASSSGTAAGGGGASSGTGGGGGDVLGCPPLPPPSGPTVTVTPAQAAELPGIVTSAAPDTTIVLEAGTYALPATLQLAQPGVTLRSAGDDADAVILDAGYAVDEAIAISASNVTVAHVTVTRAVNHPIHVYPPGPGVDVVGTRIYGVSLIDGGEQFVKVNPVVGQAGYIDEGRVECSLFRLTDAGRPHVESCCGGCYTGGIDVHAGWKWVVRQNRFEGIHCDQSGLAEHAIHFWKGSRDTLVENNTIVDCARGIGFGLGGGAGDRVYPDAPYGGAMLAHYDGIIRNNVIWADTPEYDTGIELDETRRPVVAHNTVVHGAGATAFFSSIDSRFAGTETVLVNNLTVAITERDGASAVKSHNLEGTPLDLFVDAAALDFHLAAGAAAAIDQGAVVDQAGVDMDGEAHDLGAAPDIGADERQP